MRLIDFLPRLLYNQGVDVPLVCAMAQEVIYEGHHLGRRAWHPSVPHDPACLQAAASRIRQAADLLPTFGAHPGGHSGGTGHRAPRRGGHLRRPAGRRFSAGYVHSVHRPASGPWHCRRVAHRRAVFGRGRRVPGAGGQHFLGAGFGADPSEGRPEQPGGNGVRLPGGRPPALRCGGV